MTVKHLESLQRQQFVMSQATDPNVMNKFKSGFSECMNEVGRFPGIDPQLRRRLLQHLNNVINGVKTEQTQPQHIHPAGAVQVHILPSPPSSPKQEHVQQQQQQAHLTQITATSNGYFLTSNTGTAVQLIPTKLTNGNIAFVLPQQLSTATATPVPMLVPIPTRTSSTGSAISNASSQYEKMTREHVTSPYHTPPSPANSYDAMDCKPNLPIQGYQPQNHHHQYQHQQQQQTNYQQQHLAMATPPMLPQQQQSQPQPHQRAYSPSTPLSLVMRKSYDVEMKDDDDAPWRPW
jgi:hairy and enhancer of split, invertebrate